MVRKLAKAVTPKIEVSQDLFLVPDRFALGRKRGELIVHGSLFRSSAVGKYGSKRVARFVTSVPRAWLNDAVRGTGLEWHLDKIEIDSKGRTGINGSCLHLIRRGKRTKRVARFTAFAKAA